MLQALSLAGLALGEVSPNPAVGAVVVKDGAIVGGGYTQPPGSQHAEIVALERSGEAARGAAMYVTLEPCCHFGRTPPCTKTIISSGISEVHMAMIDPNPLVSGKGKEELEEAGIRVHVGECEQEARELNEAYVKYITTCTPFVIAKFAMSLDGKIATRTGDSRWISGEEARKYVHGLRRTVDAVMAGANTVLADDPHLTARFGGGKGGTAHKQPLRIVVDGKGRVPPAAHLFREPGKTLVALAQSLSSGKAQDLARAGAEVVSFPQKGREGLVDLDRLLKTLGEREITSILVEGGGILFGHLFDQGLVDKVIAVISPMIIGGEEARTAIAGGGVEKVAEAYRLKRVSVRHLGGDIIITGYVKE